MVRVVRAEYDDGTLAGLELWEFKADGSHTETPLWNAEWEGRMLAAPAPSAAPVALSTREVRAREIVQAGGVRRNHTGYWVRSQGKAHTEYWCDATRCTCPDFQKRGGPCKHQIAARLWAEGEQKAERESLKAQAAQDVVDIWG